MIRLIFIEINFPRAQLRNPKPYTTQAHIQAFYTRLYFSFINILTAESRIQKFMTLEAGVGGGGLTGETPPRAIVLHENIGTPPA